MSPITPTASQQSSRRPSTSMGSRSSNVAFSTEPHPLQSLTEPEINRAMQRPAPHHNEGHALRHFSTGSIFGYHITGDDDQEEEELILPIADTRVAGSSGATTRSSRPATPLEGNFLHTNEVASNDAASTAIPDGASMATAQPWEPTLIDNMSVIAIEMVSDVIKGNIVSSDSDLKFEFPGPKTPPLYAWSGVMNRICPELLRLIDDNNRLALDAYEDPIALDVDTGNALLRSASQAAATRSSPDSGHPFGSFERRTNGATQEHISQPQWQEARPPGSPNESKLREMLPPSTSGSASTGKKVSRFSFGRGLSLKKRPATSLPVNDQKSVEEQAETPRQQETGKGVGTSRLKDSFPGQTIYVRGCSYDTMHAFLMYIFTHQVAFSSDDHDKPAPASILPIFPPKSAHALAVQLHLPRLRDLAWSSLGMSMHKSTVLEEIFSQFSSDHPDMREKLIEFAVLNWKSVRAQASTEAFLIKLVSGEFKNGGAEILKLLWDRFNVV